MLNGVRCAARTGRQPVGMKRGFVTKKSFCSEWTWSAHVHDLSPTGLLGVGLVGYSSPRRSPFRRGWSPEQFTFLVTRLGHLRLFSVAAEQVRGCP